VDESAKTEIQEAIKEVRDTLESEDAAEIRAKTEALQAAFHKISEAMYEKAQQEQAAASADGSPNGAGETGEEEEEEVVDAEVVDEGKSK
jgi:molecular chaperone DnaK